MEMKSFEPGVPRHVAIIMDGNGRWAQARGLPRTAGHQAGVRSIRSIIEACGELGVCGLTLYAFSTENWARPQAEVDFLMRLLQDYARREASELRRNGVRLNVIGRREGLPPALLETLDQAVRETRDGERLILNLAINYGGRAEIVDATRSLVRAVRRGEVDPERIDEATFGHFLYTAARADPDLVIRTGGEQRLSNFLLWQTAEAFFWSTPVHWPDFQNADLLVAIQAWHRYGNERSMESTDSSQKG
ncbi:MAG: di-trans,poly-cis-decaprenylcistransferase [Anaerolineae bacterium]|nr:di-trans,poly-cis-decaprenylcistransferase [Anaerolineae bacterium]